MNFALLENVQALLDYNQVPKSLDARTKYLADECGVPTKSITPFLLGEQNLPNGEVRKIADKFEVDLKWLVGKS